MASGMPKRNGDKGADDIMFEGPGKKFQKHDRQAEDRVRKNIEYGLGMQYQNEVNFSCRDHLLSEKRSPQR